MFPVTTFACFKSGPPCLTFQPFLAECRMSSPPCPTFELFHAHLLVAPMLSSNSWLDGIHLVAVTTHIVMPQGTQRMGSTFSQRNSLKNFTLVDRPWVTPPISSWHKGERRSGT